VYDALSFHTDVRAYGAVADNTTDAGAAITAAANAIQAAGSGTLYFPPGDYLVYNTGTAYTSLAAFSNLKGVNIIGNGARLFIGQKFTSPYGVMFSFDNCSNITIDGLEIIAPAQTQAETASKGVEAFYFTGGCRNINVPSLKATGLIAAMKFYRAPTDPDSYIAKNINVGALDVTDVGYGVLGQWSGWNMNVGVLNMTRGHRGFYIYGVNNARATINAVDPYATSAVLKSYQGKGCENVFLTVNEENTASGPATPNIGVSIQWAGDNAATVGTHKNINLHINRKYAASEGTDGPALSFYTMTAADVQDSTGRGHILDGFTLSGTFDGTPPGLKQIYMSTGSAFDTLNFWYNFKVENLTIINDNTGGYGIAPNLGSLVNGATFINIYSPTRPFHVYSPNGAPSTVISSYAPQFTNGLTENSYVTYIDSVITDNASYIVDGGNGTVNKQFFNTKYGSTTITTIPTQTPANATAAGYKGQAAWDNNYIYWAYDTNLWRRVAYDNTW
jgi:hypothetical protein